ncbi:YcgL domain-containing protein [Pseudocolwellia agarivorans]|uniref:YcgL domain-containing protein n=1 Tax=Pseudocolwellia agarivorans TaxID=1911682 RepID=UPI000985067C|nr:YcgL domain-containing protein [Pseudocolwellia agarivorans]
MLCSVYKSPKKKQTYLFINKRNDFSDVPEGLMSVFGTPVLVTVMNLAGKSKLALSDIDTVKENLKEKGYYLQLPPPEENLLDQHKADIKKAQQAHQ